MKKVPDMWFTTGVLSPEITGKYPMHCDYYNGALLIYPQTIHEGDAEDPATYKMHFGTYSKNFQWKAYPNYDDYYMDGAIAPNGDMHILWLGQQMGYQSL